MFCPKDFTNWVTWVCLGQKASPWSEKHSDSRKEKGLATGVSKEGHTNNLLGHESTHH